MLLFVGFVSGISGADFSFTPSSLQSSRAFPEQQLALQKAFPQQPLTIHAAEQDCTTALHQNCLRLVGNLAHWLPVRAWQLPGSLVLSKVGLCVLFLLGTVLAAGTRGRRSGAHALRQGERGGEKRGEEAAPSRNDLQEETIMSCPSCCPRCPSGTPRPCDHGEVA